MSPSQSRSYPVYPHPPVVGCCSNACVSVNIFAAWRLVLLSGGEGGDPLAGVLDATFYEPLPILLATMEVGLASICASVPIFWPVLRQHFGLVFSTKEFEHFHGPHLALAGSETELTLQPNHSRNHSDVFVVDQLDQLKIDASKRASLRTSVMAQMDSGTGTPAGKAWPNL